METAVVGCTGPADQPEGTADCRLLAAGVLWDGGGVGDPGGRDQTD